MGVMMASRARNLQQLQIPDYGHLPPATLEAIHEHNRRVDDLCAAWVAHDRKSAQAIQTAQLNVRVTWADVQTLKGQLFDSTATLLENEALLACDGALDMLLDRMLADSNRALDAAIQNAVKTEQSQLKQVLKLQGYSSEPPAELLPRLEAHARASNPYREAQAAIESIRQATSEIITKREAIQGDRVHRWEAIREAIRTELSGVLFATQIQS
jgi:hypothetical protein